MAPNLKAVYFDGGYVYNPNRIDDVSLLSCFIL